MAKEKPQDGPANFYVTTDPKAGIIFINFEKPVVWFALSAEVAKKLGDQLIESSKQLEAAKPVPKYRA